MEEMNALRKNGTLDIVDFPTDKRTVGRKWIFTVKCKSNGSIKRYKVRLVAKALHKPIGMSIRKYLLMLQKSTLFGFCYP